MGSIRCGRTFGPAKSHLPPRAAVLIGGFLGGMTGTTVGTFGSVFYAIYFDAIKLGKENYRATMTAILLTLSLARGVGYFAFGEFTHDVLIVLRDAAAADVPRHFRRQSHPPRHERTGVPPHRGLRSDRERRGAARKIEALTNRGFVICWKA